MQNNQNPMTRRAMRTGLAVTCWLAIACSLLIVAPAFGAADAPYVRTGNTEVGAFVGGSFGLDQWRAMGGGNVAFAVHRNILPYFEVSYFPGIRRELKTQSGAAKFSVPIIDYHAGLHLRFPIGQSPVVPYLVAGAGGLQYRDTEVSIRFPDGFTFSDQIKGSTGFAANFGGGLRFYTRERVGFRFEAKVYKPTGTYTAPFYKVEGGIFFQIR